MILIVTKFIGNKKDDKDTAGQADCQANDIDKGESLVFQDIPECSFYIILKHGNFELE